MVKEYFDKLKKLGIGKILLIMLAGILLLLSGKTQPAKSNNTNSVNIVKNTDEQTVFFENNIEDRLESIISKIGGVSEVDVMVTFEDSGEKILVYSENVSKDVSGQNESDGSCAQSESLNTTQEYIYENDTPYAVKEMSPKVCGVVVVYSGDKSLVTDISQAVKVLTDIEYNRIKVLSVN